MQDRSFIYTATSQSPELVDGIEFEVTGHRPKELPADADIEVSFSLKTRRLTIIRPSDEPKGYVVAVDRLDKQGRVHLTIAAIGENRFRVVWTPYK